MKKIVILQPMFFPWIGVFEQIRLADVYMHLDNVQFPFGKNFVSRVQLKSEKENSWLTIPVKRGQIQNINEVIINDTQNWRKDHLDMLRTIYSKAPYLDDMLEIVNSVYSLETTHLSELNIHAIEKITKYFNIKCDFIRSSDYNNDLKSTERLIDFMSKLNGDIYITGHGARNYLNHELFEKNNIKVEYMNYEHIPYPQLYGDFNQYVSILDLIANIGCDGIKYIQSKTINWKEMLNEKH